MPPVAADLVGLLVSRGLTVGTAESLTGGLVCAALTEVAGSSATVRGGVVAYAADVKVAVLGVDVDLLARAGAVDGEVAARLAEGVCRVLTCDVGLATTGVAGPGTSDGKPVGTVFVAVRVPGRAPVVGELALSGDRAVIRRATVAAVVGLALDVLAPTP